MNEIVEWRWLRQGTDQPTTSPGVLFMKPDQDREKGTHGLSDMPWGSNERETGSAAMPLRPAIHAEDSKYLNGVVW